MFACKRTSQKGFSLVELMVVVAIIGVLASIAVPQVNKFIAKARQSEAKANLSAYYTAQKAFQAEYGVFDSRFRAIGYAPEGELRYNIGTSSAVTAGPSNGYNPATQPVAGASAGVYCSGPTVTTFTTCKMLLGAGGAAVPAVAGAITNTATPPTFTAQAASTLISGGGVDTWTITEAKQIRNTVNGIP